jgi:hypothetical protein
MVQMKNFQFYQNMRFSERSISYRIDGCPLQRENDMEWAFDIIQNETILLFHPISSGEQITITCDEAKKTEGNLFIAGEGGPTNITIAGEFNVIEKGKILLLEDSDCPKPNVAIHELLHVLGFNHSLNPNNIMYEISKCDQTIGDDTISLINKLYSFPSAPDLLFQNASASLHGKYLDVNFSIRNNGLKDAEDSIVKVLVNDKVVKEINVPKIEIGYGRRLSMTNIWISQINIEKIEFIIENNYEELNKKNNEIILNTKK